MDNKLIWRLVRSNVEGMKARAPEGYAPIPLITIAGHADPVPTVRVQTNPNHDWVFLHVLPLEGRDDPETFYPSDRWIFVRDREILAIEICLMRESEEDVESKEVDREPVVKRNPIGFTYTDDGQEDPQ